MNGSEQRASEKTQPSWAIAQRFGRVASSLEAGSRQNPRNLTRDPAGNALGTCRHRFESKAKVASEVNEFAALNRPLIALKDSTVGAHKPTLSWLPRRPNRADRSLRDRKSIESDRLEQMQRAESFFISAAAARLSLWNFY